MNTLSQEVSTKSRASALARAEYTLRPAVDVFEDGDGIRLWADMPGVSKDRLNLRVDGNALRLEGDIELPLGENMQALYAEVAPRFVRIDTAAVSSSATSLTPRRSKRA
jgi:HSP20 family protein